MSHIYVEKSKTNIEKLMVNGYTIMKFVAELAKMFIYIYIYIYRGLDLRFIFSFSGFIIIFLQHIIPNE
jgi:hypothetical protein